MSESINRFYNNYVYHPPTPYFSIRIAECKNMKKFGVP